MPFSHTRVVRRFYLRREIFATTRRNFQHAKNSWFTVRSPPKPAATTTTIITITYNHVTTNYTATTSYSYAVFFCGPLSTAWKQRVLFFSEISSDQSMNKFDWTSWKSNETEFGFNLFSEKKIIRRKWEKKLQY